MSEGGLVTFSRYTQFIRERFPLSTHLPMILSFSCANIATGTVALGKGIAVTYGAATCLVTFLFFLRLRLFDELKDFEYDKIANPNRPLVRGLVRPKELLYIVFLAAIVECLVVLSLSPSAVSAYIAAFGFSLLMFKEFFIGEIIRPHLTTYAVLHTFVAVLMGYMVAAVSHNVSISEFSTHMFLFGFINWALFNIFEFARKTFSGDEERAGIESYSSKFDPRGAVALTASQMLIVGLTALYLRDTLFARESISFQFALMGVLLVGMAWYLIAGSRRSSVAYRALAGLYIVVSYIGFALGRS